MLPPKLDPPRGVLGPVTFTGALDIGYQRWHAPPDLSPFVEHLWSVRWNLAAPLTRETLPHPSVHWATEGEVSEVGGVERGRFTRTLSGQGRVVAVKFRPGGFAPFYAGALGELTGRRVTAVELLRVAPDFARQIAEATDDQATELLCAALRARHPQPQPRAEQAGEIVAAIAADPALTSVAAVSARFALAPLALQRLFHAKIGVSPKWVIQRYRLHEAMEQIHAAARDGRALSWADLAAQLGFTDQAHFARTFKTFLGQTPAQYRRQVSG